MERRRRGEETRSLFNLKFLATTLYFGLVPFQKGTTMAPCFMYECITNRNVTRNKGGKETEREKKKSFVTLESL